MRRQSRRRSWLHGLLVLSVATLGAGCNLPDLCDNVPLSRAPSPDGEMVAWVFVRGCGATTANSVQVSVLPASVDLPGDAGNAFIIEQESGVVAEWSAPRQLLVSYDPLAEVFKKEVWVGGVTVDASAGIGQGAADLRSPSGRGATDRGAGPRSGQPSDRAEVPDED